MKINGYEIKPSANLEGAKLEGANLEGADLRGAKLRDANLEGADVTGTILEKKDDDKDTLKTIETLEDT
jgi:uncharacterized protein YjbI with pentapeptide repeats